MQCLETKGSSISTYLITSYFTSPLASMDTNSLINCISSLLISTISLASHASHHFLFHQYHLHLITLYFSHFNNITYISSLLISLPLCHQWTKRLLIINLLNGIGNLWVLFAWNQFPPFPTDPREFYPCPTYFSMILDLSMMIKINDNMEWYIWHIDMS
jgi:hypothetical protein